MFSREDILNAIKTKEIIIDPFDEKQLRPACYTLHLGRKFAFATSGTIDVLNMSNIKDCYTQETKQEGEKVTIGPNMFVLASTKEKLSISKDIAMFVDGTTTLARTGLTVTQTAMLIQPGHGIPKKRCIVLEMHNVSPFNVELTVGMPIADGIFYRLDTPSSVADDATFRYAKKDDLDDLLPMS